MSERVSTAGMYLCYAVETTKGERPTAGYTIIPEIKTMPSFNPAPDTIDSTTLLETEWRTYVEGLKDPGGALEYGANMTDDLEDVWDGLIKKYEAAAAEGKQVWFSTVHPKLKNARFYPGKPSSIGINEAGVGDMAETTLYITPVGAIEKGEKPGLDEESQKLVGVSAYSTNRAVSAKKTAANEVGV